MVAPQIARLRRVRVSVGIFSLAALPFVSRRSGGSQGHL